MDLKKMKDIVEDVLSYSQHVPKPLEIDDLIQKWYDNKKRFIDAMDGKLVFEFPDSVTFDIPDASKANMVSELADRFDTHYGNCALADFIFEARNDFFQNILTFDYHIDDTHSVKKGSKIIKAFKYFESDKEKLVAMQNEASLLIQNAKVTGKLCLSVHPLDYLSSSENNYNWRSCHALDGEYRAGNLSYIMDEVTVVCYLKGDEEVQLPNFPETILWNNKKWRMLMFISTDLELIFAGRQYPFNTPYALETAKKALRAISVDKCNYSDWTDGRVTEAKKDLYLYEPMLYINGFLYKERNIITDGRHTRHFNDLLESSYYSPMYMWRYTYDRIDYKPITIGETTFCIKCGKDYTQSAETMLCEDCFDIWGEYDEDRCRCTECRNYTWIEDMYYIEDEDRYVCSDCVGDVATYCEQCGYYYSKDKVYYDEEREETICENCRRDSAVPSDITDDLFY